MLKPFSIPCCFLLVLTFLFNDVLAAVAKTSLDARINKTLAMKDIQDRIIQETDQKILWSLPDQHQVWLTKNPKRVAILLTSLLDLWYEAGGQAVARCAGTLNVPKRFLNLPQVGTFNNPNAEKLIALKPDLVISSNLPAFRRLIPILEENHIEYAYFNYVNFYDYSRILTLFSKLNHTEDQVNRTLNTMGEEISAIRNSVKDKPHPRVLVVFSTANSVSCELESSQTGTMLAMLGAENIIPSKYASGNRTRIQYSLERIVCHDPDYILLNTMGDVAECKDRVYAEFASNPAWAGLRAIRENRFFVLPKKYFLFKSNAAFPEALTYLRDLLYGKEK